MISYDTPWSDDLGPNTERQPMMLERGTGHTILVGQGYPVGYVVTPGRDVEAYLHARHPNHDIDRVIGLLGSDHLGIHLGDRDMPHQTQTRRVRVNRWGTFAWPDVSISGSLQPHEALTRAGGVVGTPQDNYSI